MGPNAGEILKQALTLPSDARAAIADSLLDSLEGSEDSSPNNHAEAWSEEVEKRMAALDAGRVQALPWADVQASLQARIAQTQKS